jgi:hypothetical protein
MDHQDIPATAFRHCVQTLLRNFRNLNIEMLVALLDNCGRFLYRNPDTHVRTKYLLEVGRKRRFLSRAPGLRRAYPAGGAGDDEEESHDALGGAPLHDGGQCLLLLQPAGGTRHPS